MTGLRRFFARFGAFFGKARQEAELDEEIRFHIEMEAAAYRRQGLDDAEAYRRARLRFGGVEGVKAACRDSGRLPWLETLVHDVRYGLRRMARRPTFTAVVVLTLALGIGATTALWSVVDAVLLRPLPYPQPQRLALVVQMNEHGERSGNTWSTFAFARDHATAFESVAATGMATGVNLVIARGGEEKAEHVDSMRVSAGYLETLGVLPDAGRSITGADEAHVVLLSRRLVERHFSSLSEALGATVLIGGESYAVIGVLPADFRAVPEDVDLLRPLVQDFAGSGTNFHVVGRLREGVSLGGATGELAALSQRPERPVELQKTALAAVPLRESMTRWMQTPLFVLLGAVLMVLLIACANVACLLLVRAVTRRREMALRAAIGGGRRRLLGQLLTESVLLALGGGVLGIALAYGAVDLLPRLMPFGLDEWEVALDVRVLTVTVGLTVLTGLAFGLVPALEAVGRSGPYEALREGGGRQAGGRRSAILRRGLVLAEVVLSVALLIGAGLLVRTFHNLNQVDLGFESENVLTAQMSFQGKVYSDPQRLDLLYERSLAEISRLPGVRAVAAGSAVPVRRGLNLPVRVPGAPEGQQDTVINWIYVTPGYFELLGIPHLAGRPLDGSDNDGALPVGVVNEAFARLLFAERNVSGVVGETVDMVFAKPRQAVQVVGVVGDVEASSVTSGARPTLYVPVRHAPADILGANHHWFPAHFLVKLDEDAVAPIGGIRDAVHAIDPRLPFSSFKTMEEVIGRSLSRDRFLAVLLTVFAGLALVMAAAGLYGLLSYSVVQRRREIGVRVALGASGRHTLGMVVREGIVLVVAGVIAGGVVALALGRLLEGFVYGVSTTDPATYAAIAAAFLLVALLASAVPAWQALRLDPNVALREE